MTIYAAGGMRNRPRIPTEHDEQVALMRWAHLARSRFPGLRWLHAIPNAGAGAQRGQAGKMKAEGVKRGVPDLCLPVPMNGHHGAYIEMKRRAGSVTSPEQLEWREHLERAGYAYCLAKGFDEAREFLIAYLAPRHHILCDATVGGKCDCTPEGLTKNSALS